MSQRTRQEVTKYAGGQNCRRWAPLPKKETSIAGSVIRDARASRRAGRIVIGLSAPPKNTRMRLSLASLSPMDASSRTCSTAVGRGGSLRLLRGRVASGLERTPTAKRLFFLAPPHSRFQQNRGLPTVHVTTRPANPTQSGGRRARPCRRVVLSGNTRPGSKPRRAHTHGVDRGKTPRATNTSCVTGSLLAHVESLEATLKPRPLIPSAPLRPSENPPSDTLKGPSENPPKTPPQTPSREPQKTLPSGHMGPVSAEGGRSFGHRLE